jgi:enoyl-[acyl-carrier-protein] reductase (NADH)
MVDFSLGRTVFNEFGLAGAALARVCSDLAARSELGSCPIREKGLAAAQIRALAASAGLFLEIHGAFLP